MPDRLLPRRLAIDVFERQGHFDQFLFNAHRLGEVCFVREALKPANLSITALASLERIKKLCGA